MGLEKKIADLSKAYSDAAESPAGQRLGMLFDEGSFVRLDSLSGSASVVAGFGTVEGACVYAFSQNTECENGSVSAKLISKLEKLFDMAAATGYPVVGIYDSDGANLREGNKLFDFYGKLIDKTSKLSGVVPQISLVMGTCVGLSAVAASAADLVIAVSGAAYGIETNGKNISVEDAAKTGDVQIVADSDADAIAKCREILCMLPSNNLESVPVVGYDEQNAGAALESSMNLIGTKEKIITNIVNYIADSGSFTEFSRFYGRTVLTGLATIDGESVGIVANRFRTGDGKINADGAAKAARFVRFCDAFSVPVITLVDCAGYENLHDCAKVASAYSEATTAKIAVIIGSAFGSAFITLANADYKLAWPSAVIAPLVPETACAVLYNDRVAAASDPIAERAAILDEYKDTAASPVTAAIDGIVDDVVMPAQTREKIAAALEALAGKRVHTLPKKHSNIQL